MEWLIVGACGVGLLMSAATVVSYGNAVEFLLGAGCDPGVVDQCGLAAASARGHQQAGV